ncbi:hypothetical protein GIB67_016555 [Kingdonia uniflora]|uniref:Homeobox-leucine zipper protein n=1 Tax=Kingdonia uniflora TaxID=39325 RepID=A0A7J7NQB9_9MAGN|nr:hypothetical protein GIB67_016555 [Kingdonia uniflora]
MATTGGSNMFFDASCNGNMIFLGHRDPVFRGPRSFLSIDDMSRKRPFFSTHEELIEEEFYDEQLPEKKRRLTTEQVHQLEKSFETENKLEPDRKTELAKKLGLQPRQVAVWFQNRRARWKTKQLERDYDLLKASYDSLLSDYDDVVKENMKLKSEVVSLTEKLQAKEMNPKEGVAGPRHDQLLPHNDNPDVIEGPVKAEDRLSSDSIGSAIVDEEGLQLVDSGNSYFPGNDYSYCMDLIGNVQAKEKNDYPKMDLIQSEEDDCNDVKSGYFSNVFEAAENQNQDGDGESLGWWVWS